MGFLALEQVRGKMSHPPSEGHIYARTFHPEDGSSLARIAGLIRPGTQVLDLGTGTGALGQYLSTTLNCIVDGAEYDTGQARQAAPFYRNLPVADLEKTELAALFSEGYDYIVCADVLEHLKNPGNVVSQLPALLKPDGRILLSIPNIAHAGVIAELLTGEFRYRPEGLLDATHLRFFTRKSLLEFLENHGLAVISVDSVVYDLRDSEFRDHYLEALPRPIYRFLSAYPDALTYQFIAETVPGKQAARKPKVKKSPPEFHFACQLYWRSGKAEYNEKESVCALGRIGVEHQVIRFLIPPMPEAPLGIRLDPADRPGFMQIYEIGLYADEKRCIWKWKGDISHFSASKTHQLEFVSAPPGASGINALSTGEDPYIELPFNRNNLKHLKSGGVLELKISWPLSGDFLALAQRLKQKDDELAKRDNLIGLKDKEIHSYGQLLSEKANLLSEKDKLLEIGNGWLKEQEQLLEIKNKNIQNLERAIEERKNALAASEKQLTQCNELNHAVEKQLAYQASWRGWARRPFRPLKRWYLKLLSTGR